MPAPGACPKCLRSDRVSREPFMDGLWLYCSRCNRRVKQIAPPTTRSQAERDEERQEAAGDDSTN